jgi:prepilin-type N-terminal cleavage/methylation domain-containing protein
MKNNTYKRNMAFRPSQARQKGFTIVETMVVLAAVAIGLIFVVQGGLYLRNHIRAWQLTTEMQTFSQGILHATVNDPDFSTITTNAMVLNNAFSSVGARASTANGTVSGIWGGNITVTPANVFATNDGADIAYPLVPAGVCAIAVQGLTSTFQQISVGGTIVYSPNVAFSDATVGAACNAAATASVNAVLTRTQ